MKKYIIAFSGSHGVGKSTDVFRKAYELKLETPEKKIGICTENVVFNPFPINLTATKEGQLWIFTNHINNELEAISKYDIVVSDRSAVDSIAYTIVAGFPEIAKGMLSFVSEYIDIYRMIFFKKIRANNYYFNDGIRETTDNNYRERVEDVLLDLYEQLGITKNQNRFVII